MKLALIVSALAITAAASFAIPTAPRPAMDGKNCTYQGTTYKEGTTIKINGQDCTCRDGAWDCH